MSDLDAEERELLSAYQEARLERIELGKEEIASYREAARAVIVRFCRCHRASAARHFQ